MKVDEMKIILEVNIQAEALYPDAVQLGDHAADALRKEHRSQLTGLENVAESALKVSDIFDYVKRQTARREYWQKPFSKKRQVEWKQVYTEDDLDKVFGERLLHYLEHELKAKRNAVCDYRLEVGTGREGDLVRRHVYLLLIRQFIRQLVVQYEYRVNFESK